MTQEIIHKLVKASGVQPGELILIHFWGDDADKAIAEAFQEAVAAMGASPLLLQQSRIINQRLFASSTDETFCKQYFDLFSHFDAVLDVFAYQPVVLGGQPEEGTLNRYRRYMRSLFSVLMERRRFTQIRIPTAANAEESGLEADDFIRRITQAYDIDYDALADLCRRQAEALQAVTHPVLETGSGHQLAFDLSGRQWHIDAGDGDLPCGEVYIAPIEDRTNGTLFFEKLFVDDLGLLKDVTLTIANGKVFSSNNAIMEEFLQQLPKEARVVCELGFGMNPGVQELCGYTVLDEKAVGTFHIALGANTMFGGQNAAPLHLDLVGVGTLRHHPS